MALGTSQHPKDGRLADKSYLAAPRFEGYLVCTEFGVGVVRAARRHQVVWEIVLKITTILLLILCFFGFNTRVYAQETRPNRAQLANIGNALGTAAADFAACGKNWIANSIRSRFRSAIEGCVQDYNGFVVEVFDPAVDARKHAQQSAGFTCLGDIESRFQKLKDIIGRVSDGCAN